MLFDRSQRTQKTAHPRKSCLRPEIEALEDRTLPASIFYVATTGSDVNGNGGQIAPFQSIQRAVNQAASGDFILVAGGTYTYTPTQDRVAALFGTTAVVDVVNKNLTIAGGFSTSNWSTANPAANPTTIDGQNSVRGVLVTSSGPDTGLAMQGFTIRQGLARSIPARGGDDATFGLGGGMLAEHSRLTLNNMIFDSNQAIGNNTSISYGGGGVGGGITIRYSPEPVQMNYVTFTNNVARGGTGLERGGYGQGGGIFTDTSSIVGNYLSFTNNVAISGSTNGSGILPDGTRADGIGGAAHFVYGDTVLSHVTATGNQGIGGDAPNGSGGGGTGGAFAAERDNLTLNDSVIEYNTARGGNGLNNDNGSYALGGALNGTNASIIVNRTLLQHNAAISGNGGTAVKAPTGGGAITVSSFTYTTRLVIENSVVADNVVQLGSGSLEHKGGGGGALWIQGSAADIIHSTIADNRYGNATPNNDLIGQAIIIHNYQSPIASAVNLSYSVIANHNSPSQRAEAIIVLAGNTLHYNQNLFANNGLIDNSAEGISTITGGNTNLSAASAGFVSSGSFNYHLRAGSPAIDRATLSSEAADFDGRARPIGAARDLGAFEYSPPPPFPPFGIGQFDPATSNWYLRSTSSTGGADGGQFAYGLTGWKPVLGHWRGGNATGIGVYDPLGARWYLRDSASPGAADIAPFPYGYYLWTPVTGDWDGNGTTTVGMFDPSTGTWYLRNSNTDGAPSYQKFRFGLPGWIPVVGDWTGSGHTGIGVVNPATGTWYLKNNIDLAGADFEFQYGAAGWKPVTGDWNGFGKTGIGVVDPNGVWYLRNGPPSAGSPTSAAFAYGVGAWQPLAAAWNTGQHLLAETEAPSNLAAPVLQRAELQQIANAALDRLSRAGVDPALVGQLRTADYEVGTLPAAELGVAYVSANRVVFDSRAAGRGWFVDPTPGRDEEFTASAADRPLTALNGPAAGREDLLTAVLHEMGHLAGRLDVDAAGHPLDLMADVLPLGVRRDAILDRIFAG